MMPQTALQATPTGRTPPSGRGRRPELRRIRCRTLYELEEAVAERGHERSALIYDAEHDLYRFRYDERFTFSRAIRTMTFSGGTVVRTVREPPGVFR
jgi:hypothetical protein